jgi:hypothetical protein
VTPYLTCVSLFAETIAQTNVRVSVGRTLLSQPSASVADNLRRIGSLPVQWLTVYRWANMAARLDKDHPLLPLFWMIFFSLFFANTEVQYAAGASRQLRQTFGFLFFNDENSKAALRKHAQSLGEAAQHHRVKAGDADLSQQARDLHSALCK